MNAAGLLDLALGQFIFWFVLEIWEHEARSSTGLWRYSILTFKDVFFFYFSTLVLRLSGERRISLLSTQSSRNQTKNTSQQLIKNDFTPVNAFIAIHGGEN